MRTISQRLKVVDFMQRDVITVSPDDTLREALDLMTGNHVTGLPVMNSDSRCIGLITASDILNYENDHASESVDGISAEFYDPETQQWSSIPISAYALEEFGDVRVSDVMTTDLISVERDTPLVKAARRLVEQRVHRLLVLDKDSRLFGILSAYDFARAVAES